MVTIKDFTSNSVMGVVRKVVNYLCDTLTPKVDDAIDHLPSRFNGTFDNSTRNLTMVIESQGASAENLTATVNIPGGSGGTTYTSGNGINITSANVIEIDTGITATVADVDTKVAKNQGTANAGKVLGIGSNGMVEPVDSSGGEWISVQNFSDIPDNEIVQIVGFAPYFEFVTIANVIRFKNNSNYYYSGVIAQEKEQMLESDFFGVIYTINSKVVFIDPTGSTKRVNTSGFNWYYKI